MSDPNRGAVIFHHIQQIETVLLMIKMIYDILDSSEERKISFKEYL